MRLIDGNQRQIGPAQTVQRARGQQPLGRDIEQIELAGGEKVRDPIILVGLELGMQGAGRHAELAQGGHLIVHQRDQWRDDQP